MVPLTDQRRKAKKSIIAAIYILLWVLFLAGLWALFGPPAPTCFDKIQNGGEWGVDCGGSCALKCELDTLDDLITQDVAFLPITSGKGDLVAILRNPNANAGAKRVSYKFSLKDAAGNLLKTISDQTRDSEIIYRDNIYVLPQSVRPIIHPAVSVPGIVAKVEFSATVARDDWELKAVPAPQIFATPHPDGPKINQNGVFYEFPAKIRNSSALEFKAVNIDVMVLDNSRKIIAVNRGEVNNLRAGETRDHYFTWYAEVPGLATTTVSNFSFFATTNVYQTANIVQPEAPLQDFQRR